MLIKAIDVKNLRKTTANIVIAVRDYNKAVAEIRDVRKSMVDVVSELAEVDVLLNSLSRRLGALETPLKKIA